MQIVLIIILILILIINIIELNSFTTVYHIIADPIICNSKSKKKKRVRFSNNLPKRYEKEKFYGNPYKNDYDLDDEYYKDKLGTKGYNYNKINNIKKCDFYKKNNKKNRSFCEIVNKLEIYDNNLNNY